MGPSGVSVPERVARRGCRGMGDRLLLLCSAYGMGVWRATLQCLGLDEPPALHACMACVVACALHA